MKEHLCLLSRMGTATHYNGPANPTKYFVMYCLSTVTVLIMPGNTEVDHGAGVGADVGIGVGIGVGVGAGAGVGIVVGFVVGASVGIGVGVDVGVVVGIGVGADVGIGVGIGVGEHRHKAACTHPP